MNWGRKAEIGSLVGKTIVNITGLEQGSEIVKLTTSDGRTLEMYHCQDGCESVTVEDVCGNVDNILASPVISAECVTNENENPAGVPVMGYQESWTWTFYNIDTTLGGITIRWYGESNGYYSETVDLTWEG